MLNIIVFSWVFCLYIKLYAYICNVFFMVLELRLTKKSIFDFKYEDFELTDYNPHPHIAGKVAV